MPSIALTDSDVAALQALLAKQGDQYASIQLALSHPLVDLADFAGDIRELIRRARGASRHVSEDFQ